MSTQMDAVRRVTQSIVFFGLGVMSLLMAAGAFNGVMFLPSGGSSKSGPPSKWSAQPIDSPAAQIFWTVFFTLGGIWMLWRAHINLKQPIERNNTKRKKKSKRKTN
ncbi:hypothetical protein [Noviherbaspirillum massiliense]|uniref:hypothetical protein n=1 Tax=Noviherbaspirillum massiliense TaxID=1465823 RepID=UPI0011DE1ED8|nr:hypothetical protein [Noviherbaspirillum massiliense]